MSGAATPTVILPGPACVGNAAAAVHHVLDTHAHPSLKSMRVHLQWTADGVQLWLGMDGTSRQIETHLGILLPELERALSARGLRLARVTCNGQTVWTAATPADPPTRRSPFLSLNAREYT